MMSDFRFHTIKQRQGQSVDSFLTHLHLALPEGRYTNGQEKFEDQFIYGIMVYDIQESLLKTIKKEDGIAKCLHEAHKTESMIEQCKMLRIQRNSGYDWVQHSLHQGRS